MFYKISSKSRDLVYAVAWCEGDEPSFQAIFYYLYGKEWRYVGPKLKDIIVGYDPDEDWEWGFHIIDDDAEKITKEEAQKIVDEKIGGIDNPNTGIMFSLPINNVKGLATR